MAMFLLEVRSVARKSPEYLRGVGQWSNKREQGVCVWTTFWPRWARCWWWRVVEKFARAVFLWYAESFKQQQTAAAASGRAAVTDRRQPAASSIDTPTTSLHLHLHHRQYKQSTSTSYIHLTLTTYSIIPAHRDKPTHPHSHSHRHIASQPCRASTSQTTTATSPSTPKACLSPKPHLPEQPSSAPSTMAASSSPPTLAQPAVP